MKNNIVFNRTLEEYNKKYRNRRNRLLLYTKKEVEEFDKKNPNLEKGYLLKNKKWWFIEETQTYYEVPKAPRYTWFRNLNGGIQVATCALLGGAVITAIVVPTVMALTKNPVVKKDINYDDESKQYFKDLVIERDSENNYIIKLVPNKENATVKLNKVTMGTHELVKNYDYEFNAITKTLKVINANVSEYGKEILISAYTGDPSSSCFTFVPYENNTCGIKFDNTKQIPSDGKLIMPDTDENNNFVTEVVIEGFKGIKGIKEIQLPIEMSHINYAAFKDCTDLEKITFPKSMTIINKEAFKGCASLTSAKFEDDKSTWILPDYNEYYDIKDPSNIANDLKSNKADEIFGRPTPEKLYFNLFGNDNDKIEAHLGSIINGDVVYPFEYEIEGKKLPVYATGSPVDMNKNEVTSIILPKSVEHLFARIFCDLDNLRTLYINENCKGTNRAPLMSGLCANDSKLESIVIPKNIKNLIGCFGYNEGTFKRIISYSENYESGSNNDMLFEKQSNTLLIASPSLKNISEIPSSTTKIGEFAFAGNKNLESVEIPSTITSIGNGAFYKCPNLKTVKIHKDVTSISGNPFMYCPKLEKIEIDSANSNYKSGDNNDCIITKDADLKLLSYINKEDIVIDSSVKCIDDCSFNGNLAKTIKFPNSFSQTNLDGSIFTDCKNLEHIFINTDTYSSGENNDYIYDIKNDILVRGIKTTKIPSTCKQIGSYAFEHCDIKSLDLSNLSIKLINNGAFKGCIYLEKVIFPNSLEKIMGQAFSFCHSLKKVELPNSVNELNTPFTFCNKLEEIKLNEGLVQFQGLAAGCKQLRKISIPRTVTKFQAPVSVWYGLKAIEFKDYQCSWDIYNVGSSKKWEVKNFCPKNSDTNTLRKYLILTHWTKVS